MIRFLALAALSVFGLVQSSCSAKAQGEQQTLVDRATLTMQEMMTQTVSSGPRDLLRNARAVMICPQIFKAGFFLGGEGGNCVLVARGGNGAWSYPAFYSIGSGSFGFQFGIEDNELFMLIMTEHGLNAILDSQIKLGANAGLAIATIGAGVQGSTTTAVGADIVAFSEFGLVRWHRDRGQCDVDQDRLGPSLLRPAVCRSAVGEADAGGESGGRSVAGYFDAVWTGWATAATGGVSAASGGTWVCAGLSVWTSGAATGLCSASAAWVRGAPSAAVCTATAAICAATAIRGATTPGGTGANPAAEFGTPKFKLRFRRGKRDGCVDEAAVEPSPA